MKNSAYSGEKGHPFRFYPDSKIGKKNPPNHGGHIAKDGWRRFEKYSGGHILEKCCHDIDIVHWFVGSLPVNVASFGGLNFYVPENKNLPDKYPEENGKKLWSNWPAITANSKNPFVTEKDIVDNQVSILEFKNGVRATFHTNTNAAKPERRFYIIGALGTITADLYHNFIKINNHLQRRWFVRSAP